MSSYTMRDFGAIGDGKADDSLAFAKAFAMLKSGGHLLIEAGNYLTGPLAISASNLVIELEKGAVISFIADENLCTPIFSRWEGVNCYCMHPCLLIKESDGIIIKGEGVLDGNGRWWWERAKQKRSTQVGPVSKIECKLACLNPGYKQQSGGGGGRQSQFLRPPLVQILNSNNVMLQQLTLQNSPFWTLHPLYSTNLFFLHLTICNPKDAPNTDGIDVDSCRFVTIKDCLVDVGDDGIALKSGSGPDGVATGKPTTDIVIERCTVKSAHGGAVIGSETAAGIRDVVVSSCFFDGTDRGIRIKTRRGRGGVIENLRFEKLRMRDNLCPLTMNMYYRCGSLDTRDFSLEAEPVDSTTPRIENIVIEDCCAEQAASSAAFIVGLPEAPIKGVSIKRCNFSVDQGKGRPIEESEMYEGLPAITGRGIRLRNAELACDQVVVEGVEDPFVIEDNVVLNQ